MYAKLHNNACAFLLKGLTISVKCTASLHPFAKDANDVALYSRVSIESVLYKRESISKLSYMFNISKMKGEMNMIYFKSISEVNVNDYDEVWFIVRSNKNIRHIGKWVPALSPSKELFFDYLSWKKTGKWNKDMFENVYRPRFIKEILNNEVALNNLNYLYAVGKEKDICLVCYCKDERLCHRSIIKQILIDKGCNWIK